MDQANLHGPNPLMANTLNGIQIAWMDLYNFLA
jgi:hypothetical protein